MSKTRASAWPYVPDLYRVPGPRKAGCVRSVRSRPVCVPFSLTSSRTVLGPLPHAPLRCSVYHVPRGPFSSAPAVSAKQSPPSTCPEAGAQPLRSPPPRRRTLSLAASHEHALATVTGPSRMSVAPMVIGVRAGHCPASAQSRLHHAKPRTDWADPSACELQAGDLSDSPPVPWGPEVEVPRPDGASPVVITQ